MIGRGVWRAWLLAGLAWLLAVGSLRADESTDPPYYQKRATWQETMLLSRQAMRRSFAADHPAGCFRPFTSEIVRGAQSAMKISLPVAGQQDLFLYVSGAPDIVGGAGTWADAKLIGVDGKETLLCHLKGLEVLEGRSEIDRNLKSGVSGPLRIAGREFQHGLHVYAPSKVRVPLGGKFARLEAWIGIDDWVGNRGAVRFHVAARDGAARLDLWNLVMRDFPEQSPRRQMQWERMDGILEADWEAGDWVDLARRYAEGCRAVPPLAQAAAGQATIVRDEAGLADVRGLYYRAKTIEQALHRANKLDFTALRLAIKDLGATYGAQYPSGDQYSLRLATLERSLPEAIAKTANGQLADYDKVVTLVADFDKLQREALLDNPLLDFGGLLLIKRVPHGDPRRSADAGYGVGEFIGLPRQTSKCNPGIEAPFDWDNEIAVLSPVAPEGKLTTVYRSDRRRVINDLDLHWDGDRLLFSMPGSHDQWQVFEVGVDGRGLRQVTPGDQPDVHNYDACYLPSGKIAFISTAPLQGVPCNAGVIVGMMYRMDADGSRIEQICFEQDHDHCPTVMNDGRLLYLRWDYTDTPHVWNRMLFTANPDGTNQMEFYGANSYWPNAIFYARPIPGHPTKVVGIVTGHHVGRVGELTIFDPAQGRREADGVVQQIPGRGRKVAPVIEDKLTEHSWPKFLHPYPLSEKYFLVSCKPTPDSLWGIYLVDVFDNMVLLREEERHVLLEPIPIRKTCRPPVIPDKVVADRTDATVYMEDIYRGPAMKGVPRGTVKQLRVFAYHFGYQRLAGIDHRIGADGPWEVKRVLGTVPVESDGSSLFRVPAKMPLSVQPLDSEGKAVQLMRSWLTAMPGETVSCVGCHENRGTSPPSLTTMALRRGPSKIEPWRGPARGFSFMREVQPVLDKYCVACHDGTPREGKSLPDLRGDQGAFVVYRPGSPSEEIIRGAPKQQLIGKYGEIFDPSYVALRRYVRVGGLESDLHELKPLEFAANTSHLVQMLRKGHHNVKLDSEAWDRLITWIDLNAPCHGTWSEFAHIDKDQRLRRRELQRLYGGVDDDAEALHEMPLAPVKAVVPEPIPKPVTELATLAEWPFDAVEAGRRQARAGMAVQTIDLGRGVSLQLVRIPPGQFVMGDAAGEADESPCVVSIERPFWMGRCEVTNEQFARFDPKHDSRFEDRTSWIFSEEYLGWPMNGPKQPVVRVTWQQAMQFCDWLSKQTGMRCTLPSEAQWEYACRAGTPTPLSYGGLDTDFAPFANLADYTIRELAYEGWRPKSPDLAPRDARFNDGCLVTAEVARFRPNAWGLYDMHGNAAEWTRSAYRAYPYREDDGRNDAGKADERVVRGGSWFDVPKRARAAYRWHYPPYQPVFNVGFRVVCETPAETQVVQGTAE